MKLCPTCGNPVLPIELRVNLDANTAIRGGQAVKLTRQCAEILSVLARAAPEPIPHERLAYAIWGGTDGPENVRQGIQVQIHRLRRDLKPLGLSIVAHRGTGYALVTEPHKLRSVA